MKKYIFILFLAFTFNSKAQDTINNPSMPIKEVTISNELKFIRMNLRKSHNQFKTGAVMYAASVIPIGLGFASNQPPLIYAGGVISLIGTIVMINSHKYIGRAGIGFGGEGVKVRYVL